MIKKRSAFSGTFFIAYRLCFMSVRRSAGFLRNRLKTLRDKTVRAFLPGTLVNSTKFAPGVLFFGETK